MLILRRLPSSLFNFIWYTYSLWNFIFIKKVNNMLLFKLFILFYFSKYHIFPMSYSECELYVFCVVVIILDFLIISTFTFSIILSIVVSHLYKFIHFLSFWMSLQECDNVVYYSYCFLNKRFGIKKFSI